MMNEFIIIEQYFKPLSHIQDDISLGIGDDAACIQIPDGMQLLVSCDTLVDGVHFLSSWDPFNIAYKALMVNISDIAAMGGTPKWITLALTLLEYDDYWLHRFAQGLQAGLETYNMSLIGGDTTRGPLSLTVTIHGIVPIGKAVTRMRAKADDHIYVSGTIGAAAQAVDFLGKHCPDMEDNSILMDKLLHPFPRVDLGPLLQRYASAAIDISDGLSADLSHICEASGVGACLYLDKLPVHPLVLKYQQENATSFSLSGGDDYEICFTIPSERHQEFKQELNNHQSLCTEIGLIESALGIRGKDALGSVQTLSIDGYRHF